jgi:hypothetical protein
MMVAIADRGERLFVATLKAGGGVGLRDAGVGRHMIGGIGLDRR